MHIGAELDNSNPSSVRGTLGVTVTYTCFVGPHRCNGDLNAMCLQARSLLTSHEDFTTLMFHNSQEILKPGFVWAHLKRHLPEAVVEEVQRLTLTKDDMAAVFDVPSKRARVSSEP